MLCFYQLNSAWSVLALQLHAHKGLAQNIALQSLTLLTCQRPHDSP